jgi:hypothetical protein
VHSHSCPTMQAGSLHLIVGLPEGRAWPRPQLASSRTETQSGSYSMTYFSCAAPSSSSFPPGGLTGGNQFGGVKASPPRTSIAGRVGNWGPLRSGEGTSPGKARTKIASKML